MSTPERPTEFNFPLSFTGPDGIGATPFEVYAEAERPDVCDDGQDPALALRRTLGMFATGVTVIVAGSQSSAWGIKPVGSLNSSFDDPPVISTVPGATAARAIKSLTRSIGGLDPISAPTEAGGSTWRCSRSTWRAGPTAKVWTRYGSRRRGARTPPPCSGI